MLVVVGILNGSSVGSKGGIFVVSCGDLVEVVRSIEGSRVVVLEGSIGFSVVDVLCAVEVPTSSADCG